MFETSGHYAMQGDTNDYPRFTVLLKEPKKLIGKDK